MTEKNDYLDMETALNRMGGRRDLYEKLLIGFIHEYQDYPVKIKELIAEQDDYAYIFTHSLKNMAASIAAEKLRAMAEQVENLLKNRIYQDIDNPLGELIHEFNGVLFVIQGWNWETVEDKKNESTNFSNLVEQSREALMSYSPKAIKKCRQMWKDIEINNHQDLVAELCRNMQLYHYKEAQRVLDSIEEKIFL